MFSLMKKGLIGLVVLGALVFSNGCTLSIEGLGDLYEYLPIVVTDCGWDCGYDTYIIEHED